MGTLIFLSLVVLLVVLLAFIATMTIIHFGWYGAGFIIVMTLLFAVSLKDKEGMLTIEEVKDKVRSGSSGVCFNCGSENNSVESFELPNGSFVSFWKKCKDCNSRWGHIERSR